LQNDWIKIGAEEIFQYGFQQKGALAVKLSIDEKYMWLNTHFTLEVQQRLYVIETLLRMGGSERYDSLYKVNSLLLFF